MDAFYLVLKIVYYVPLRGPILEMKEQARMDAWMCLAEMKGSPNLTGGRGLEP
jgi:hypothetical protein